MQAINHFLTLLSRAYRPNPVVSTGSAYFNPKHSTIILLKQLSCNQKSKKQKCESENKLKTNFFVLVLYKTAVKYGQAMATAKTCNSTFFIFEIKSKKLPQSEIIRLGTCKINENKINKKLICSFISRYKSPAVASCNAGISGQDLAGIKGDTVSASGRLTPSVHRVQVYSTVRQGEAAGTYVNIKRFLTCQCVSDGLYCLLCFKSALMLINVIELCTSFTKLRPRDMTHFCTFFRSFFIRLLCVSAVPQTSVHLWVSTGLYRYGR